MPIGQRCSIAHRIDRLEQADLVNRIPDPIDRQGTLVRLTDRGFNTIEQAVEAHVAISSLAKLVASSTNRWRSDNRGR